MHSPNAQTSPASRFSDTDRTACEIPMDFAMDSPFVRIEEEEILDPRDFLPSSLFTDSANDHNLNFPFVEPPPEHPPFSPPVPSSPPLPSSLPPFRAQPLPPPFIRPSRDPHQEAFVPNPLIPSTSITRSPSVDTTSTQAESAVADDDPMGCPLTIVRGQDRPRLHSSNPDAWRDYFAARGGFKRIPGSTSGGSHTVSSPGTLRRINALPSDQFRMATRAFGAKRAATAKGDLASMRNERRSNGSEVVGDENCEKTAASAATQGSIAHNERKNVTRD